MGRLLLVGALGRTAVEVEASLPLDELVANAWLTITRAVTVNASPAEIYPWIVQMGVDRSSVYSLLWVENLMGLRVKDASAGKVFQALPSNMERSMLLGIKEHAEQQ